MADTEEFVFDSFRDQPDKLPQDVVYDQFRSFVKEHGESLQASERDLDESFGDVWDMSDPIVLKFLPDNNLTFEEVLGVQSKGDPLFYKVMLVTSSLVAEVGDLVMEAKERLLPALSTFGEQPQNKDLEDGEVQLSFGRMLPLFLDLSTYVNRCHLVIVNIVRQLASVYNDRNRKRPDRKGLAAYQNVHFTNCWIAMADLMHVLITLDQIATQTDVFQAACTVYKRMMKNARNQPEKYDTDAGEAEHFGILLGNLEKYLLDDVIFLRCLRDQNFELPQEGITIHDNLAFMHEFDYQLREIFNFTRRGQGMSWELDQSHMYVGLCGLYVMYFSFFKDKIKGKSEEKKFFKTLFEVHKKVPVIHLIGNTTFNPAEWLAKRVPDMSNSISSDPMREHEKACKARLQQLDTEFEAIITKKFQEVVAWSSQFESRPNRSRIEEVLNNKSFNITKGLYYAKEIGTLIKTNISLHVALETPLNIKKVRLLCKAIEILKSISATFHRKSAETGNLMSVICEFISFTLQRSLVPFKRRMKENQAKLDDGQIDQMSAVDLMLRVLYGPPSRNSLIVLKAAIQIVTSKTGGYCKETDFEAMKVYLRKLELVSQWQTLLTDFCDCSFLYWQRVLLPKYFETAFRNPVLGPSLVFMFSALHDPAKILLSSQHLSDKKALFNAYQKEIEGHFKTIIIDPLCREIENTLRLNIHSVVLGQGRHELGSVNHKDYQHLLNIPSLQLFGQRLSIRDQVQSYLEKQFYNLTALQPHDWKTYEEIRALAKEKYNMTLTEAHLPGQILDQGLDILEITRSIHIFVTRYTYNINSQIFVEKPQSTTKKQVHSLHIRHIANSIRTHGTGMMNTTVNFVFRFLTSKFYFFSQFLFDDHVKSRLIKDIKWYDDHKEELRNNYPVQRAEKFVKDIRRLGVENGKSFLDQYRNLITEIGNGLGYVRMVRTGGMRAISESISFVPSLEEIPSFEEMLEDDNFKRNPDDSDEEVEGTLPESTLQAARNLDTVLQNQSKKFSEGSEYFKLLEGAFKEELNSEKNEHLQNFYAIIPPLTISYMEHMISQKEGLTKKGREGSFSDDGFALGVMFILKLLNLNDKFDSLHWFESVRDFYRKEKQNLEAQIASANATKLKKEKAKQSHDSGELSTLKLTDNRIRSRNREYELMLYSFRSTKVFFKEKRQEEEEMEDEEEEEDMDDLDEA